MTLNIESLKAEQLALQVASEYGESITQAVIIALEERLERFQKQREDSPDKIFHEIMKISRRCSSLPDIDSRSAEDILNYNYQDMPE